MANPIQDQDDHWSRSDSNGITQFAERAGLGDTSEAKELGYAKPIQNENDLTR